MKILQLSLLLLFSLQFMACNEQKPQDKKQEEEKKITKEELKEEEKPKEAAPKSMKDLLQGEWKAKEGMGFLSFKGDTVDMNPMGVYTYTIDEATQVISYTPIDGNGVAHKNKITKLTEDEFIEDPAEDGSGQHEEYVRP